MSDQHAQVEAEAEAALRLGLAVAAQTADRLARARQDLARDAQHRSEQEARQLEARYRAEGASATARLAVVDRAEWWDRATGEQIAGMYELAAQWRHDQPHASGAVETIARQVQDRYGIDLHAPAAAPAEIRAALARIELERADRAARSENRADDAAKAAVAVAQADRRDAALAAPGSRDRDAGSAEAKAQTDLLQGATATVATEGAEERDRGGAPVYDSAERREQAAADFRSVGLPDQTIAVAMRADVAQGRPAEAAAGNQASEAHRTRTHVSARRAQRADRER